MDINKVQELIAGLEAQLAALKQEIAKGPKINVRVNGFPAVKVNGHEPQPISPFTEVIAQPVPDLIEVQWGEPPTQNPAFFPVWSPEIVIQDPSWPEAVEADILCSEDSFEDKAIRADISLDVTIETNLEDKRFLDYGCGDGHMAAQALRRGVAMSVGYDIDPEKFATFPYDSRLALTSVKRRLEPESFDVILLHDVLDHCEEPGEVLNHVASLLAPGGTVYVACHPWTGRHGGHLYQKINKAWAHLFLDQSELLVYDPPFIQHLLRPQRVYKQWFMTAGFQVRSEEVTDGSMEPFFRKDPKIWNHLTRHFVDERHRLGGLSDDDIQRTLEVEFVNYALQLEAVY